jgi:hypothetical protein
MPRPENVSDIELDLVEIASFEVNQFNTDGTILKHYGAFIEGMQRAGHTVEHTYGGTVRIKRAPSLKEQSDQLVAKQDEWDRYQKYYDQMAAVGHCESEYSETLAKRHAMAEGLTWPPPVEPIESVDVVIRDIEELAASES